MANYTMVTDVAVANTINTSEISWDDGGEVSEGTPLDEAVSLDAEFYMRIAYLIIGVVGMSGNLLVVVIIFRSAKMRQSITNIFILNQSSIDFTAAFFIVTTSFLRDIDSIPSNVGREAFCRLWMTNLPIWGIFVSSTYNLVALTFDRYLAILHPMLHNHKCSKGKVYTLLPFVWCFGIAYNAAYMIPTARIKNGKCTVYSEYPDELTQRVVGILTVLLQYFIPLSMIAFAYIRIALVLHKGSKMASESAGSSTTEKREMRMLQASRNTIKTLLLVSVSFVMCWSPNQIFYTMYNLGFNADFNSAFYHFTVIAVFVNCCINPFIYTIKYEQFQQELLRQLKCCKGDAQIPEQHSISNELSKVTSVAD